MPKLISDKIRAEIKDYVATTNNQHQAAKKFNCSFMFVNSLVNNRPIKRTRTVSNSRCPITGFKL